MAEPCGGHAGVGAFAAGVRAEGRGGQSLPTVGEALDHGHEVGNDAAEDQDLGRGRGHSGWEEVEVGVVELSDS